jgi:hypothetical protein
VAIAHGLTHCVARRFAESSNMPGGVPRLHGAAPCRAGTCDLREAVLHSNSSKVQIAKDLARAQSYAHQTIASPLAGQIGAAVRSFYVTCSTWTPRSGTNSPSPKWQP